MGIRMSSSHLNLGANCHPLPCECLTGSVEQKPCRPVETMMLNLTPWPLGPETQNHQPDMKTPLKKTLKNSRLGRTGTKTTSTNQV